MANVKISQLTDLLNSDIDTDDSLPITDVLTSSTKKIKILELDKRWANAKLTPSSGSTEASPYLINSAGEIPFVAIPRRLLFVSTAGGNVSIVGNQIANGDEIGQELVITGTSLVDYPTLRNGAGFLLNGDCLLKIGMTLYVFWTGTVWKEISRT